MPCPHWTVPVLMPGCRSVQLLSEEQCSRRASAKPGWHCGCWPPQRNPGRTGPDAGTAGSQAGPGTGNRPAGHHPERPALTPCRLGLDSIAWLSDHPGGWAMRQIALMPNPDSALMLFLAAHIEAQTPPPTSPTPLPPDCSCRQTSKPARCGNAGCSVATAAPFWNAEADRHHSSAMPGPLE
jgi:hypothetical protein